MCDCRGRIRKKTARGRCGDRKSLKWFGHIERMNEEKEYKERGLDLREGGLKALLDSL